jgi:hypothetical protein
MNYGKHLCSEIPGSAGVSPVFGGDSPNTFLSQPSTNNAQPFLTADERRLTLIIFPRPLAAACEPGLMRPLQGLKSWWQIFGPTRNFICPRFGFQLPLWTSPGPSGSIQRNRPYTYERTKSRNRAG